MFAIRSIDLQLNEGDLFGFIGPNGAGKTTTMRIIATLLNPTWGEAYVCGNSIYTKPKEIRRLVGYMPDFFGVYDDMKVIEYLEFFAAAYRIRGPERRKRCDEMLDVGSVRRQFEELAQRVTDAQGTKISAEDAAEGFLRIAVENMANAIKKISVQRGYDVTEYTLNCFGGAGGQHACQVADALGMTRVFLSAGALATLFIGPWLISAYAALL